VALAGPFRTAALWLGAGGAVLAALIALTQSDHRDAMVYIGAAQGGLVLFVAAAGAKTAVWASLLALTPLRLLIFLAADAARNSGSRTGRKLAACLFALGGLALVVFGLLTTWWAREAEAPLDALFVVEVAVALVAAWMARASWWLFSDPKGLEEPLGSAPVQWMTVGLLGGGVLAGGLAFGPLAHRLGVANHIPVPAVPRLPALLRYVATAPALLAVTAVALVVWQLQRRLGKRLLVSAGAAEETYNLEEGLARAAQALRAVVEVGIAERIIALVVQAVVNGAHVAWAVEHRGFEGIVNRSARAVVNGAGVAHRLVEQECLEGLLRRIVQDILVLSRRVQRWHTGRLRHNLMWVFIALGLAVLALVVWGGW
jgi:hypothetical protein